MTANQPARRTVPELLYGLLLAAVQSREKCKRTAVMVLVAATPMVLSLVIVCVTAVAIAKQLDAKGWSMVAVASVIALASAHVRRWLNQRTDTTAQVRPAASVPIDHLVRQQASRYRREHDHSDLGDGSRRTGSRVTSASHDRNQAHDQDADEDAVGGKCHRTPERGTGAPAPRASTE